MSVNIGPHDQYFFAVLVLVGTYGSAFLLLWLAQRSAYAGQIKTFRGIAQNSLTVINVLFALNLAFLANDTWSADDRALNTVFQEAGRLRTIMDLSERLPDKTRAEVVAAIRDYARLTVDTEWAMLGRRPEQRRRLRPTGAASELTGGRSRLRRRAAIERPFRDPATGGGGAQCARSPHCAQSDPRQSIEMVGDGFPRVYHHGVDRDGARRPAAGGISGGSVVRYRSGALCRNHSYSRKSFPTTDGCLVRTHRRPSGLALAFGHRQPNSAKA